MQMTAIKINGTTIDFLLANYTVKIKKAFDENLNFKSVSGKQNGFLGNQREITVSFEPMETAEINSLFNTINDDENANAIQYIDPKLGLVEKNFECSELPAATWFIADNNKQYWTIPDIVFTEIIPNRGSG